MEIKESANENNNNETKILTEKKLNNDLNNNTKIKKLNMMTE